ITARHKAVPGTSFHAVRVGNLHPPFVAEFALVESQRLSLSWEGDDVFEKVHAPEADVILPVVESFHEIPDHRRHDEGCLPPLIVKVWIVFVTPDRAALFV